ncbi:hypothetical protein R3W88_024317 [Solanum pinnatisectum]|uniref:Uncharacterized protein n=1 Tax=Solanum pinnatisectum TaxID=50273 RepID=A0AAV9M3A2_9SOLN|nr:hypothetical protein R3W88_024317 [Solanum pinnatisectum]
MQLMDEVSKNNRAWHTRDSEIGDLGFTFEFSAEQRKREERDQDMAHMRTQIDVLMKHIVTSSKKVNVVGPPNRYEDQDINLDEEAKYLDNQGGFWNNILGNQGYHFGNASRNYSREGQYDRPMNKEQGNWLNRDGYRNDRGGVYVPPGNRDQTSGSSSGSKLEDILAKIPRPPTPFPQRLKNKAKNGKFAKFITMLRQLSVNIPLVEALEQMPGYAKFMKDMVTKKRDVSINFTDNVHH